MKTRAEHAPIILRGACMAAKNYRRRRPGILAAIGPVARVAEITLGLSAEHPSTHEKRQDLRFLP